MNELLLYGPIALPALAILLILAILYQMSRNTLLMGARLDDFEKSLEMATRVIKEELTELTRSTSGSLDTMRVQASWSAKELREEIVKALTGISETTARTMGELGKTQKSQLDTMAAAMNQLSETNAAKLETVRSTVETKLRVTKDPTNRFRALHPFHAADDPGYGYLLPPSQPSRHGHENRFIFPRYEPKK